MFADTIDAHTEGHVLDSIVCGHAHDIAWNLVPIYLKKEFGKLVDMLDTFRLVHRKEPPSQLKP